MRRHWVLGSIVAAACATGACLNIGDAESHAPSGTGGSATGGVAGGAGASGGNGGTAGLSAGGAGGTAGTGGAVDAGAPFVRVQRGKADLSGTTQSSAPLQSVDPARSVLLFTTRHDVGTPSESTVLGRLGSQWVDFERLSGTGLTAVEWQVVEHSAFRVQRGTQQLEPINPDIPLATPVDLGKSFALVSQTSSGAVLGTNDCVMVELPSAEKLRVRSVGSDRNIAWQVVELTDGSTVRRGTTIIGAKELTAAGSLVPPIDTARSFLFYTVLINGVSQAADARDVGLTGLLESQSQVSFTRGWVALNGSSPELQVSWFVVELASASVASPPATMAAGEGLAVVSPATSLELDRAFVTLPWLGAKWTGGAVFQAVDVSNVMLTAQLSPAGELVLQRSSSFLPVTARAFVVKL